VPDGVLNDLTRQKRYVAILTRKKGEKYGRKALQEFGFDPKT
jgi:hypothetical protein